jgi:glycosyltransferase involved in cell wall biosynthesis
MVNALLARGHTVVFHCLLHGATEDHSILEPVIVPEARLSKLVRRWLGDGGVNRPRAFPNLLSYFARLKEIRPDVLIARDPSRAFSLVAALCARLLGTRIVFYSQDPLRRRYSPARRAATWLLLRLFAASWYTPLCGAKDAGTPPGGRYFLPFVVEDRDGNSSIPPGIRTVLMVGKYESRKNHLLLIEALAPIMAEMDVRAVIIGECATPAQAEVRDRVVRRIRDLGLVDRISLVDNVPHQRMTEFYRAAHLFVLPASDEPAAISVLEAIAAGVPAICSDSCGTRFYIQDGVTGAVFASGSREALERVLRDWLRDEDCLHGARESCRVFAASSLSKKAFYDQFRAMMAERWPTETGRW